MTKEKQIKDIENIIFAFAPLDTMRYEVENAALALYHAGYRKQSKVIDEFANRLKEAPIKCGLPLFGLSTKGEIEEYFNGIMLQVRDAIDSIAEAMKGENK